jgi:hypothetical protein
LPLYYFYYPFGIFILFFISRTDKDTHLSRKSYSRLTKTIASQCQHLAVIDFSSGPVAHSQWKLIRTSYFCQIFSIESTCI